MRATRRKRIAVLATATSLVLLGCAGDGAVGDESSGAETAPTEEGPADEGVGVAEDSATVETEGEQSDEQASGSMVDVTIVGVSGYRGGDLAGIVEQEADGLVVGGFATTIDEDDFTTTQRVLLPAEPAAGPWPSLAETPAQLPEGEYVLTVWVDIGLGGYTRWFPGNTDGQGLAGCVYRFAVSGDDVTDDVAEIVVGGDVRSTGYVGICEPQSVVDTVGFGSVEARVATPVRQSATRPFAEAPEGSSGFVYDLVVWQGDFLAVGGYEELQPLPDELPTEIAEAFPPEVQDLFPDGLPPTLDEAIAVIQDAGLMSEVTDAIASIPGAEEAIFSVEQERTDLFARSPDGAGWEPLDVVVPDEVGRLADVAAVGDHLVVVGQRPVTGTFQPTEIGVGWTDDLVSWSTAVIEPALPDDLPEGASIQLQPTGLVANSSGWVVSADTMIDLGGAEPPTFPSAELERYLVDGGWGFLPVRDSWFAPWDGEPSVTMPTGGTGVERGLVVATDAGFAHLSDVVRFSDDGMTWEPTVMLAPEIMIDPWMTFTQQVPGGFVMSTVLPEGDIATFLVDDRAEVWTPLDVPGLPSGLGPAQLPGGADYVLETFGWSDELGLWIVATPDGERWFLEEYYRLDPEAGDGYEPRVAALDDDGTLLVGTADLTADDWWSITF
jgi:hypothetical protein